MFHTYSLIRCSFPIHHSFFKLLVLVFSQKAAKQLKRLFRVRDTFDLLSLMLSVFFEPTGRINLKFHPYFKSGDYQMYVLTLWDIETVADNITANDNSFSF